MFIRENITCNKKTKKRYITHRLVESVQTEKGPRQRVIMHLGTLSLPKEDWRKLATILEDRLAGQISFLEEQCPEISRVADHAMEHYQLLKNKQQEVMERQENSELALVDLQSAATSESRSLGPELVAHTFWERQGFDGILKKCGLDVRQRALAKAVIIGRLIQPGSDWATWRWLKNRTSLLEMLSTQVLGCGKDAIYDIGDVLFAHKDELERELRSREVTLFSLPQTIFLYDLTNAYFEGSGEKNSLAHRGKSKEKRSDCVLVTLALVVDSLGFPIYSRIYPGNQPEPITMKDVLDHLEQDRGLVFWNFKPTVVMDRGIATKENMELLKDRKYHYIVIERRAVENDYVLEFENAKQTFDRVEVKDNSAKHRDQAVYVKKIDWADGSRVLCLSEGREQKEQAMDILQEKRFVEDITRLQNSVTKGNIVLAAKVAERIGRIKARYQHVTHYYDIHLEMDETQKKVKSVVWQPKPLRLKRSALTGCYVIETSHQDMSARDIWQQYMTLTKVEQAFSDLETALGLRPVYHQLAGRTCAHLFISVLAYHLLVSIEHQLRDHGDHREWPVIKTELSTHTRNTIILTGQNNQIYHLRISGTPEPNHKDIYRKLGVQDPLKRRNSLAGLRKQ